MSMPEHTLPQLTTAQTTMLMSKLSGGVIPRYNGMWYLHQRNGKVSDFGGNREGTEVLIDTALRELEEESGIKIDDITNVHGVFCGRSYGVILVEVDEKPVAMEPGSTIVRMKNYNSTNVDGRLFVKGLEFKMRDIETDDTVTAVTSRLSRL
jgi:8-oxo-dGTP pyrophosphatase MutT (NUDIX family)